MYNKIYVHGINSSAKHGKNRFVFLCFKRKKKRIGGPLDRNTNYIAKKLSAKTVGSTEINLHLITNQRIYFGRVKKEREREREIAKKDLKLITSLRSSERM